MADDRENFIAPDRHLPTQERAVAAITTSGHRSRYQRYVRVVEVHQPSRSSRPSSPLSLSSAMIDLDRGSIIARQTASHNYLHDAFKPHPEHGVPA